MAPLAWVRRIAAEIPELNTTPLFGNAPPFDWHHFSSLIASRFTTPHLRIRAKETGWRELATVAKGLGTTPLFLPITVSPIGTLFWVISHEDMMKLTSWMLKSGSKTRPLTSEILQEGFYRYLVLETLQAAQEMAPLKTVTLQLSEEEPLFAKAFCIDVEIGLESKSCWGRLAIPLEFQTTWVAHFSHLPPEYISQDIASTIQVSIPVTMGSVILRQEDWGKVSEGDFILLDRGSLEKALLTIQTTPIFNANIKQNQIELTDYAFYQEGKGEAPVEKQESMPLCITIEIARLTMTLDELMHLMPGATLDLLIHPEQGVSLTIDGEKMAQGELIYLGEQLGVRILKL